MWTTIKQRSQSSTRTAARLVAARPCLSAVLIACGLIWMTGVSGPSDLYASPHAQQAGSGSAPASSGKVLLNEDFSHGMKNWWAESEGKVWTADGRLYVDTIPASGKKGAQATIWCKTPIHGNVKVEYDAHILASDSDANNINTFLFYSNPSGKPLYDSRAKRDDALYTKYHDLNGYIFTFVLAPDDEAAPNPDGTAKGRFRIRRCPGFHLLTTKYTGRSRQGVTYHVTILKRGGELTYQINGKTVAAAHDDHPLDKGQLGLRTWRTRLWWDNIRVSRLPD